MTSSNFGNKLYPHQVDAVERLKNGSILRGGVGSGKSRVALAYYQKKVPPWCKLYIITTARKRDTEDWEEELKQLGLLTTPVVDSWNNIKKYLEVSNAFFVFDEQRVIGSGAWAKSFLKITKKNLWILLSATPGDTWMDYVPVFVANGFYKNRTTFIRQHVVYRRFVKYPMIDYYLNEARLERLKREVLVEMPYQKRAKKHCEDFVVDFNTEELKKVKDLRWDVFHEKPLQNASAMVFAARKVVNSDPSRVGTVLALLEKHGRLIVFYNFDYELDILRSIVQPGDSSFEVAEWNGHKHEPIPDGPKWLYLVQYTAGSEGWNCVETNAMVFYSLNYSYRIMHQSEGRIDRLNTPFENLYYYRLVSRSFIDRAILKSLKKKRNFNEAAFVRKTWTIIEEGVK
jgi:hypothetical protein